MTPKEDPVPLRSLDGHRVAIELTVVGRKVVCHGTASYEIDATLGRVVRVPLEGADGQEIIVSEADFDGAVEVNGACGCQFLLRLS